MKVWTKITAETASVSATDGMHDGVKLAAALYTTHHGEKCRVTPKLTHTMTLSDATKLIRDIDQPNLSNGSAITVITSANSETRCHIHHACRYESDLIYTVSLRGTIDGEYMELTDTIARRELVQMLEDCEQLLLTGNAAAL